MRAVVAFGAEGGRLLESLVFAACTEDTPAMRLVWVEPDTSLVQLQELLEAYESARSLLQGAGTKGFHGAFELATWTLSDGSAAQMDEDTALLHTLLDRQESAAQWRSRADRHPNLAALACGAQMGNAPVFADLEDPVLCGAVDDSWSAAGMLQLAHQLKEAGADPVGVILLPHSPVNCEKAAIAQETLRRLAAEQTFCRTYLVGMPEGCRTESMGAHLIHWLGARALLDGREQPQGVYCMQAQAEGFVWADFGASAEQLRKRHTALLRTAGVLFADILPILKERLDTKPRLGQKRVGWYNAYFRTAHKLEGTELAAQRRLMDALELLCTRYVRWVLEVVASLPPQWQDREAFAAAEQAMAEQYRRLLEAAGQLSLMDEEIQRSGMAKEQLVRRGAPRVTAADELLRKADEQRVVLSQLESEQDALAQTAGGEAKKRLMARMVQGIDLALEKEAERVKAWKASPETQGAKALQVQESIYRLETHMRILQAERARVLADQQRASQETCKPPHLTDVRLWGNDLFEPELLGLMAQYLTTEDEKERRAQAAMLSERCGVIEAMGRDVRQDTLLQGLFARMLEAAEEVG